MLFYDRIDVSKGNDVIKQVHQKSVMFFTIGIFRLYFYVLNKCMEYRWHNLLKMSIKRSGISFLNKKGSDYRCIISLSSKDKVTKLLQNADLTKF